jgi:hypothetical protein
MRWISTFSVLGAASAALALSVPCAGALELHTPEIHPPTVHTPTVNTPNNTTTTTTTTQNHTISNLGKSWSGENFGQKYPQGVEFHEGNTGASPTVTIDGRTMRVDKGTPKLIEEAEEPPPKMWENGQLVPIPKQ